MPSISSTLGSGPHLSQPLGQHLDQLRKYELVVKYGSFTAAADHLGLTQPAISQQIRALERQLGVRLLERVGRSVTPTAAGKDLLAHLPAIAMALEAAFNAVAAHVDKVVGQIRLGTGLTTCLYFLPPILRKLKDAHPGLDLVVSTGNTEELVRRVEANSIDLALVTLPVPSRSVDVQVVVEDEIVAVKRRGSADWPDRLDASSFSATPLVMFSPGTSTRGLIDAWLSTADRNPSAAMELDSVEAIKAVVAAGLGSSFLPRLALTGHGHHADLEFRSLTPRLYRSQALVMRQDKTMTAAFRATVECILASKVHLPISTAEQDSSTG
ncbi:LysR family transcriptional regulator [Pigmentiphaga aceris]|uniref:LysR family transcriptional regulator n=1 Tax=Pigmentiphaga aceris TaxID=1940612 RepID=A0A5C0AYL2_9BURK|nr:LysR family transcriptional regulator [Pigmentiphaga aceris]QEI07542.1 LysR family transcriptional regulator [Pigmentiphaga aceris]